MIVNHPNVISTTHLEIPELHSRRIAWDHLRAERKFKKVQLWFFTGYCIQTCKFSGDCLLFNILHWPNAKAVHWRKNSPPTRFSKLEQRCSLPPLRSPGQHHWCQQKVEKDVMTWHDIVIITIIVIVKTFGWNHQWLCGQNHLCPQKVDKIPFCLACPRQMTFIRIVHVSWLSVKVFFIN